MRLYCVQFICKQEEVWLSKTTPFEPIRSESIYWLNVHLFLASDDNAAYEKASSMIVGFEDANHDGPGDRTNFSCVGIHELEEVYTFAGLESELNDTYGLEVTTVDWSGQGVPPARSRDDLEVFRPKPF
ncbi:hypothetical protein ACNFH8_02435 [Pseudomonas sp. NY15436]|uniref:hypothetical protein n=1 Tax=Pseudomonas sp. NY15436 TaxID=3400359 RepID=UPI003A88761A